MKHADGTYDLTVDDIHEIRVETSKKLEKMNNQEIIAFFNNESKKFLEQKQIKDVAFS